MESKKNKLQYKKFPKSALAFYIKLYCKHKGSSKSMYQSKLMEATKSWLSLSEAEKLQLHKTYKENEHKFKQQLIDKLKNAEPFLKLKETPRSQNDNLHSSNINIQASESYTADESLCLQKDIESDKINENAEDVNLDCEEESSAAICVDQCEENDNENLRETVNINEQAPRIFLVEPLAPTLKNSKDLFHMLNSANEDSNVSWMTLSAFEKNQYRRAVSLLKKDYITKYRDYLESLTPRELFDHYNKTLF